MRLTTHSEYALLALLYLSRHSANGELIPLSRITEEQKLPFKYMEHIMHTMLRAGLVSSSKGQKGGYKLARKPGQITVAQVIRLFDGPLAPVDSVSVHFYKPTIIEKEKKLTKLMKEIRDYISVKLEKTTLKDLV
jgi:Rrf2 family protein